MNFEQEIKNLHNEVQKRDETIMMLENQIKMDREIIDQKDE